ncbi:MAG: transporter substrate-binding domain-containing protein [Oscillospiraceae bacterium]
MKKFTKLLALSLALAAVLALSACGGSKSGSDDPIVVYTNAYFAPFEYYEGTDIVGVDIDIMNKVGENLGRDVEFTNVEFSAIIDNVSSGKLCDVGAAGITITESRQEQVDFSTPYFTSVQYVIYAAGAMEPDGTDGDVNYILWDSLAGKKIGVQMDTTGDIYVDGEINATEDNEDYGYDGVLYGTGAEEARYESAQLAVDAIGAGQVDVVVVDYLPASYIVDKNDGYECAALYYDGGDEADYPTEEQYAICVTKGEDELLEAINSVLSELGEDGINDLVMKHMGLTD